MIGRNHAMVGFATAANVAIATWSTGMLLTVPIYPPLLLIFAAAGAYKADLDIKGNKGQRAGFGAALAAIDKVPILKKIFGHRGFTHIYYIPIGMYYLAAAMHGTPANVAVKAVATMLIGWAIGYASHLFIDGFNGKGLPALFPVPFKVNVFSITSGTLQETVAIILIMMLLILNAVDLAQGRILL